MKLASIRTGGRETVAVLHDGAIVDVARLVGADGIVMETVLPDPSWLEVIASALQHEDRVAAATLSQDSLTWLPPSPRPSKIVGVALNNQIGSQFAVRAPTEPAYFLKPPSALTGHQQPLVVPAEFGLTHPEPELAAVIAKRCKHVEASEALDFVFGYTITNDITSPALKDRDSMELALPLALGPVPDWRRPHGEDDFSIYLTYHARSKGCDTFAPMGPWITTADEVPNPNDLRVQGLLDGEAVLDDTTSNLRFGVEEVIAHLSTHMTLEAGDVVHFGTAFMPADPERFPNVRAIDISRLDGTLSVEIDGLGRLDNPITHEPGEGA